MNPTGNAVAVLDSPGPGEAAINDLGLRGHYVSSPTGRWHLLVEDSAGTRSVRWALLDGPQVYSSGSTDAQEVLTFTVGDDATMVVARRTGRLETTIDLREADGQVFFSTRVEALATSCAVSTTSQWAAVGFIEAKRGDEPVVLIETDRRLVFRRIPSDGAGVRSVDEDRRVVITESGELPFGEATNVLGPRGPDSMPPARGGPTASAGSLAPAMPMYVEHSSGGGGWIWLALAAFVIVGFFVVYVGVTGFFHTEVPAAAKRLVDGVGHDVTEEYEMAARHGTKADRCREATRAAEWFLRTNNERSYAHWKDVEKQECQ